MAHNASFENSGAPKECVSGEGEWQHWVITFDGYYERIYLNGDKVAEKNMFLMIRPEGNITLGSSMDGANKFSGYVHSLQFLLFVCSIEQIYLDNLSLKRKIFRISSRFVFICCSALLVKF